MISLNFICDNDETFRHEFHPDETLMDLYSKASSGVGIYKKFLFHNNEQLPESKDVKLNMTAIVENDSIIVKNKYSSVHITCHEQFFDIVNFFGLELCCVNYQTEEICLAAVKNNGEALKYVHHQTDEICRAACLNNRYAIKYMHDQNEEFCLDILSNYKNSLGIFKHIRNPSVKICLEACKKDKSCLEYIDDMTLRHKIIRTLIDQNFI